MVYGSQDVLCPFYKDEKGNVIRCEGIISMACVNNFTNAGQKNYYKERYCCSEFAKCKLAEVLYEKYS